MRAFLRRLDHAENLADHIPGPAAPFVEVVSGAVEHLARVGAINDEFFAALVRMFPRRRGDIEAVAAMWDASPAPGSDAAAPAAGRSHLSTIGVAIGILLSASFVLYYLVRGPGERPPTTSPADPAVAARSAPAGEPPIARSSTFCAEVDARMAQLRAAGVVACGRHDESAAVELAVDEEGLSAELRFTSALGDFAGEGDPVVIPLAQEAERAALLRVVGNLAVLHVGADIVTSDDLCPPVPEDIAQSLGLLETFTHLMSPRCAAHLAEIPASTLLAHCEGRRQTSWQCKLARYLYTEIHSDAIDVRGQLELLMNASGKSRLYQIAALGLARVECREGLYGAALARLREFLAEPDPCVEMWTPGVIDCLLKNRSSLSVEESEQVRALSAAFEAAEFSSCSEFTAFRAQALEIRGWHREQRGELGPAATDYQSAYSLSHDPGIVWRLVELRLRRKEYAEACSLAVEGREQTAALTDDVERLYARIMAALVARRCELLDVATELAALEGELRALADGKRFLHTPDESLKALLCAELAACEAYTLLQLPKTPARVRRILGALRH